MKPQTLIVGLGSSHGDDQFGWRVAEKLTEFSESLNVTVRVALSPTDLVGWLDETERLILCDACQGSGLPGKVHFWRWPDDTLSAVRFSGSHDLGLVATLALAEGLGWLPPEVSIWCAEGTAFHRDQSMSPPVEAAVNETVGRIQAELMRERPAESTKISLVRKS